MSMNYYSDGIVFSLLDNDLFMQWILSPTAELDLYWKEQMDGNDELKVNIESLKNIINKLEIKEPVLSQNDRMVIWDNIQRQKGRNKVFRRRSKPVWLQIASAVAAIALLIVGYLFFSLEKNGLEETDYTSIITNDEQSIRSTDIVLTLPDNKKMTVDSANIVYDKNGVSNVQSEKPENEDDEKQQLNQLMVPYGKTVSLTLSDGTKIWVNSGSRVIYPSVFKKDKREIFVLGEIYLDVVKIPDHPFVIKTNYMDINVLGTKLNVSAYSDESVQSVVLVSGAVTVKSNDLNGDCNILPDQMFSYKTASKEINIQKVDVNNYISWINGYLLLDSERLDNVFQKLERHYNLSFSYDDNTFKNIRISGKLDFSRGIESVFKYVSIAAQINYEINDQQVKIELKNNE
ncbi:iron dicitrate transporter FecR [Bacteroidia bacterium]|nr:iron dicitrate transporter FecR [Bacteroidia bacterium]